MVIYMCRQAQERDIFKGDLNRVQAIALTIAMRLGMNDSVTEFKANAEHLNSLFDAWMALEKPEAYDAIQKKRAEKADEVTFIDISQLDRDDMAKVVAKMKRLAAMERGAARR